MRRIIVLGAGIAGVTTAWYLAAGGAEVTVVESESEPAAATSRANGGHVSTQSAAPWTGPAAVREFLATRFAPDRPVRIERARDPGRWRWFAATLAASRPPAHRRAAQTLRTLARISREEFDRLAAEQRIDAALESGGVLGVYRSARAFARARKRAGAAAVRWLAPREALALEPALAESAFAIAGAVLYPGDATADCRRFCVAPARCASAAGVEFRYRQRVTGLAFARGRLAGVETDSGPLAAADCVVALGSEAAEFLRPYGLRLPILPLRGYTLSAAIAPGALAPGRFVDVERRVVFSRLGTVFRAAGMADFAGHDLAAPSARREQLVRIARGWYPALEGASVEHWSCLRPMTPDGPPVLGASPLPGVWLNTGLGSLGWTLGCGAGRIVADLVLGRASAPPLAGVGLERFGASRRHRRSAARLSLASRGRR